MISLFSLDITIIFFCYLLGSLPTGLWISRYFCKKDLRFLGSGNIGSSNAARVLGLKFGFLFFLLDFLKGFLPVLIFNKNDSRILFGMASILGYFFSIFNNFRGGKAIATSVGVVTAIEPFIGFIGILFFLIFLLCFGYASLASIIATFLVNFFLWISYFNSNNIQKSELWVILFITILICVKHYNNIIDLIRGKENKFFKI